MDKEDFLKSVMMELKDNWYDTNCPIVEIYTDEDVVNIADQIMAAGI